MDHVSSFPRLRRLLAVGLAVACIGLITNCGGGGNPGKALVVGLLSDVVRSVAYGDAGFVTQGKFSLGHSSDGTSFTYADSIIEGTFTGGDAVTYGSAGYVASSFVGDGFVSSDGVTWSLVDLMTTEELFAGAFGAGGYVFVGGNGTIVSSRDAQSWQGVASGTGQTLFGIAWVGDQFIAAGGAGTVLASSDGISWESRAVPTSKTLRGIAVGDGVIIVTGVNGVILRSTDGVSFARVGSPRKVDLLGAAFGDGRFVVVGRDATVLASEDDGQSFRAVDANIPPNSLGLDDLVAVAFGGGRFVAVGDATIWSDDGITWVNVAGTQGGEADLANSERSVARRTSTGPAE